MSMAKTVLITGGFGFLGRAVALRFKRDGFRVLGLGHGRWATEEARESGFDSWLDAGVNLASLLTLNEPLDVVVHCAGNGSVGYSLSNPLEDFYKTVQSTADLAEFLRLSKSKALIVYPSSAGVYGARDDAPIAETDVLRPISPYGHYKKISEEILATYADTYGIRVAIVRFFSIYGPGLTKQLLWDAGLRFLATSPGATATFWGTGEETRDWINVSDAASLIRILSDSTEHFSIVNGASGRRTTVRETLDTLKKCLDCNVLLGFNQAVREGDPRFYHADIGRARALGWSPAIELDAGMRQFARWLRVHRGISFA